MTDEELDQWRGQEAWRRRHQYPEDATEVIAARLAREGWTPPEPVVDPDLLAFREWWASGESTSDAKRAFLAGARMAREQERERAKVLLRGLEDISDTDQDEISYMALNVLAKYRGEA